ncbi:hypothetical protein BDF21DRAFT_402131 [Thamnidium elegans]|nr:hypothetical protein BDF21DRAFT_402131 [Thamnidium elegans]
MSNYSLRSWSELPAELLQYILQEVYDKKTIFQCQLVCKSWKKPAERVAYHTITISSYNPQLKKLVSTLQSLEHLGERVNKINFNIVIRNSQKYWDRLGYFEKLSGYCPNVKVITSKNSCYWLWTRLLMQQHRWKNLQEIPRPIYSDNMGVYIKTAYGFYDRLTNLTLILNSLEYVTVSLSRTVLTKLLSDLSTFKCLKHLEIEKLNGLRLEEVDEILDSCPKLISFSVHRRHALIINNRHRSNITENTSLLDKIDLFKPKINLKKFSFCFTTDGGKATLNYIMHVLPSLETLHFNPNFYKTDLVCSNAVIMSFLQYSLSRTTIDVKYLACDDITSLLPVFWQSEAYRAANKTEVSLAIEETNLLNTRPHHKPYIGMTRRHEVTVTFVKFDEACSRVELIENIGSFLTNLKIGSAWLGLYSLTATRATSREAFLDHIFEYCPLLKRLEGSFHTLQFYRPKLSIHTSMEELVLISTVVHPTVLEQLSIQLPNLKRMSFLKKTFTKYDGKNIHRKKLEINMPNTRFDKLYVVREFSNQYYSNLFLKHSSENGDQYFYVDLKSDITRFSESSHLDYSNNSTSKTTHFLNLRCHTFRELVVEFDKKKVRLLA